MGKNLPSLKGNLEDLELIITKHSMLKEIGAKNIGEGIKELKNLKKLRLYINDSNDLMEGGGKVLGNCIGQLQNL